MIDISKIKKDFPILKQKVNGKRLVYLDSAATSQKPKQVIDAIIRYYNTTNSNIHRAIHFLGEKATAEYEATREKVAKFIGAKSKNEIIFVRNTTEAINLVAYSWARNNLKAGDEIVLTIMEHHSNIVPWQQLQAQGVRLRFVGLNENLSELNSKQLKELINEKTKLVTFTAVSNVFGTISSVRGITEMAHKFGARVLVDGAQYVPHVPANLQELGNPDFFVFSAHKMLGPTGVGVLYAKEELLNEMKPFLFGGDMIKKVEQFETEFNELPWKFEAGTPNIADVIAFGAAIDYLEKIGMENVWDHSVELAKYALEKLSKIKDVEIYGSKDNNIGVVSFNIKGAHPHDVAQILDSEGIAIRSGHACAMPLMQRLGVPAVCRASFYIYNDRKDVDALVNGLEKVKEVLKL